MLTTLFFIFLLILLSAFFSGSETAIVAVSPARLYKEQREGNKRALLVKKLQEDRPKLISSLLFGNNLVNILSSSLSAGLAIDYFGENGIFYSTIIMTVLILVFAEVLPKTYAIYNAEQLSLFFSPFLVLLVKILSPVTSCLHFFIDSIIKILSFGKQEKKGSSLDELRGAIELQHIEGNVVKRERDMLDGVLDLNGVSVDVVMTHRKNMFSLDINLSVLEMIENILNCNYTRIPLWQDNSENVVGVIHVKELFNSLYSLSKEELEKLDIRELMSDPWFIPEKASLSNQLYHFRHKRNHLAFVVDEYGAVVGLLTLEDILEEIVGSIEDEYDKVESYIKKSSSGEIEVEGDMKIRDINRSMDWSLPEEKASTIAGLLIDAVEDIPDEGSSYDFYGLKFEVLSKEGNQIKLLKLLKQKKTSDEEEK